jgi:hypothetical protein
MTLSTHWIYVDENNRVHGFVYQSQPIDRSSQGAIACEYSLNKDPSGALYDPDTNTLTYDAHYEAFHTRPEEA